MYSGLTTAVLITRQVWGSRVKRLRQRAGLTQAALAREMGLGQQAVAAWETGRAVPRPDIRVALAVRLGDTAEVLESALSGDDDPAWEEKLPPLTVEASEHQRRESDRERRVRFLKLLQAHLVVEGYTEFADLTQAEIEAEFNRRFDASTGATATKTKEATSPDYLKPIDLGDGIIVNSRVQVDKDGFPCAIDRKHPLNSVNRLTRRRLLYRQRLLQERVRVMVSMADHPATTEVEKALLSVVTMLVDQQNEVERLVEAQIQVLEYLRDDLGKTARVVASMRKMDTEIKGEK